MSNRYERALRTFNAASLTGSPQNVGAVIPFVTLAVTIFNNSTVDVLVGDGSTQDDIRVPAGATLSLGEALTSSGYSELTNKIVFNNQAQLDITQVTAPGTGTITINCFG